MIKYLLLFTILAICLSIFSIVIIEEGNVGIKRNFGILDAQIYQAGIHFIVPFAQIIHKIPVIPQTTHLFNIDCNTVSGMKTTFNRIDITYTIDENYLFSTVKNSGSDFQVKWIKNQMDEKVHTFCKDRTLQQIYIDEFDQLEELLNETFMSRDYYANSGIKTSSITVFKPDIPEEILEKYKELEEEKIRYNVLTQRNKSDQIENEMKIEQIKIEQEAAKVMNEKLTPEYLQYEMLQTIQKQPDRNLFFVLSENFRDEFANMLFGTRDITGLPYTVTRITDNLCNSEFEECDEEDVIIE